MTRTVRRLAALLWGVAILALASTPPAQAEALIARAAPLRILALGDSITAGVNAFGAQERDGGYRGPLERLLAMHGYRATFVGSRSDYSNALADRRHEGWPGYVVRSFPSDPGPGQLVGSLTRTAMRASDPDVVLLMAGTNDLLRRERGAAGYTVDNIVQSVHVLLDEIVGAKPSVFVVLAPVVNSPKIDACALRAFAGMTLPPGCSVASAGLADLVADFDRRGYHVSYAPQMATAVPRDTDHFPDGLHPSGSDGYAEVAAVWLNAIEAITQPAKLEAAQPPGKE